MTVPPSPLQGVKLWLVGHAGLAKDALHIYVALALFFGSALLFRWPLRSWKPLMVVVLAAMAGEIWDLRDSRLYHTLINLRANWHDVWNTCFWPALMMILARTTELFRR